MKKSHWLQFLALNLLVALCIVLPYLPGPSDKLAQVISGTAQVTGFIGLLLVPIGTLWLIGEIKKIAGNPKAFNNWSNGYYYAITALVICMFICLIFTLAIFFTVGLSATIAVLILIGYIVYKCVLSIQRLKRPTGKSFHAAPLYLLSVPVIAFSIRFFFIAPVSDYSRNYAMKHAEKVIDAIENYHAQRGDYPESIEYLYDIPKPSVIGIERFIYERNGNAYNLSFVQWQHLGATREVVMFNKYDEHNIKGYFASYHAKKPHWKYYWLD